MRYRWAIVALLAVLVAGISAPATLAQEADSVEEATLTNQQARDMGLTDGQRAQIHSIQQTRREQLRALRDDTSLTGEERAARVREINRSSNEQIRGLLTPEQQRRYQRRVRGRREDRRDRREDVRDRREDRRDAAHDGGPRDRREDIRDRREDRRDRREDHRKRRPSRRPRPPRS